jgi:ABC-type multidrug transport system fused ATPase/permease subunit
MKPATGNFDVLKQCFRIFPKRARERLILFFGVQATAAFLDLLGVAMLGFIGILAVRGVESVKPGSRTQWILRFFHLQNLSFQSQALLLGVSSAFVLIARTLFSVYISRKALHFIGYQSSLLAKDLLARVLNQPLLSINTKSMQETIYAVTSGVERIGFGVIGLAGNVFSDLILLIVLFSALLIANFILALATLILFSSAGIFLYLILHRKASKLGVADSKLQIEANKAITEVIGSYRELVLRDRRATYISNLSVNRKLHAQVVAETTFMPNISKYVIEAVLVLSALILCGLAVATQDAGRALALLTVFLAASTRISPALLRIQQSAVQIRNSIGTAKPTLDLFSELKGEPLSENVRIFENVREDFKSEVELNNVSFTYPGMTTPALQNINLHINPGDVVAIVGSSGAGKSTLVDVILGIIPPSSGSVLIGKLTPLEAYLRWPGAVSYVPQTIEVADASIRENLTLGYASKEVPDKSIEDALAKAQLLDFSNDQIEGFDFYVGERGNRLSGGQRQRLGIARALLTSPEILVLDEATSALDSETELSITESLNSLRGSTTLILVAHRLASVRSADKVVYMENGQIKASGTFEAVRNTVPHFDRQAKLLGL